MSAKPFKLKKAPLVYFVIQDTPKRMDYRFNYERTPESALKFRLGQWFTNSSTGKLARHIFPYGYNTREEAEAKMSEYNRKLYETCTYPKYEIA